ncbi:MAG: YcxB family protein [Ruminococcus sp.]|nr:YcxB family protein [Ruminococcus sp.]
MKENYRLEKEYKISVDIFREGYREYQKKYVYPKSYVFMGLFALLAADFIYAAVREPDNLMSYLLVVVCLGFAVREWYNPRKIRRSLVETYAGAGQPVYKISVGDGFADISTVSEPAENNGENADEEYALPEPTRIPSDGQMNILEYEQFFLLVYGKSVFYIIPSQDFTEDEKKIIRCLKNREI